MKHLLPRLLALSAFAPLVAVAQGAENERWTGWCDYNSLPGETFPAPRLNLPEWVCVKASRSKLHEIYDLKTTLNPFFLTGDFNGDGKQDLAVWVERKRGLKALLPEAVQMSRIA
jgi:hypothetical protein